MRSRVVLCLVVAASLAWMPAGEAASAGACPPGAYPIHVPVSLGHGGWVAYKIKVSALNTVGWEALTDGRNSPASAIGLWLLDSENRVLSRWTEVSAYGEPLTVSLSTSGVHATNHVGANRGLLGAGIVIPDQEIGVYRIVLAAFGKGDAAGEGAICGENFEVLGSSRGTNGFIEDVSGFGSTASAYAGTPGTPVVGGVWFHAINAGAAIDGRVERVVSNSFFGDFFTRSPSAMQLSYMHDEHQSAADTRFRFDGAASGHYDFDASGFHAGPDSGVWCWGADVSLP